MQKNLGTKKLLCLVIMAVIAVSGGLMASTIHRPDPATANATTQASAKTKQNAAPVKAPTGAHVAISFPFARTSVKGSDQFAIWVENEQGQFVRTIFVTKYTSTKGANKYDFCLPTWSKHSGMRGTQQIDMATGATPETGTVQCYWDLTDQQGNPVHPGTYHIYVEGTQSKDQQMLCQGTLTLGTASEKITASPSYTGQQPQSPIIGPVNISYVPQS